jgi:hypothetical protein
MSNQCVPLGVNCNQSSVAVGATVTCQLTENSTMCPGCNATITAPDGTKSTVTADPNGNIQLPLSVAGTYQVTNGQTTGVTATAPPQTPPATQNATQPPPTAVSSPPNYTLWIAALIILIVLILLAIYLWRRRSSK